MGINFKSTKAAPKKSQPEEDKAAEVEEQDADNDSGEESSSGGSKSWFKRGAASSKAVENYEHEMEEKWADQNRMREFWLEDGEEARVTFVDGDLTADGHLDILTYREHHLKDAQGHWGNKFVCTAEVEPCPICEMGNDASLVGVLTVIDHRKFESKKKAGVFYEFMPRLYKAKKNTIKKLQSLATKREGLAGCTFDIQRIGDQSPRVGSDFDFVQKDEIADLKEHFTREYEDPKTKKKKTETFFTPADYEKEIGWIPAKELREKYGFGGSGAIGGKTATMPQGHMAGAKKSGITFKGKL